MTDVDDLAAEKDAALEDLEEAQERIDNVNAELETARQRAEEAEEQSESSY